MGGRLKSSVGQQLISDHSLGVWVVGIKAGQTRGIVCSGDAASVCRNRLPIDHEANGDPENRLQ